MIIEVTPKQATTVSTLVRLRAHFARLLDVPEVALQGTGLTIRATERRRHPEWLGWLLPFTTVGFDSVDATVVSCLPELEQAVRAALAELPADASLFRAPWPGRLQAAVGPPPDTNWAHRLVYAADAASFRPHGVDPSVRIERFDPRRAPDAWIARAFDGPVFVVRDRSQALASWAGVKQKSHEVWEIAAITEPHYQGRGLATLLTATATAEIVASGRIAVWVANIHSERSRRLVEHLGYRPYAEQLVAERFAAPIEPAPPSHSP